ncbi:dTMP kinase [Corynebacterium kozikiae]|uniref:dTMP kinase n=1 Tax=Corynebacterium kozikiae TaxID=2968469 RepID=UPI00211C009B|nr:dTMP kinase [Corynebacterium sp. 76QC2CO]
MIIAIEGIDGAGKNTLMGAIREALHASVLAFPRYQESVHAQLASKALYGQMGDLIDSAYAMATLFALDRADAAQQVRAYQGIATEHLLLDRYVASNVAYSVARTQDPAMQQWVEELEFSTLGVPTPDLQVFLATPPELAMERAAHRAKLDATREKDAYEQSSSLQHRVDQAFHALAESKWVSPWIVVEPSDTPADVVRRVQHHLS